MKHVKIIVMAVLAVFVVGAVAATSAMAETGPQWGYESKNKETKTLTSTSETLPFTSDSVSGVAGEYELRIGATLIKCKKVLAAGSLIGGNPGTTEETVEISECTITGNGSPCGLIEPIKTTPVTATLAEETLKKSVVVLFEPKAPGAFAALTFSGTGCSVKSTAVEGSIAAEVLTGSLVLVELGKPPVLEVKGELRFPATTIKTVWVVKGGTGEAKTKIGLKAFGTASALTGESLIELVGSLRGTVIP